MKPKGKKNNSKRLRLNKKHNIEKRVKQSKRKARKALKAAKKAGAVVHKKKERLEIPNNWPFKKQELQAYEQLEKKKEEQRLQQQKLNKQKKQQAEKQVKKQEQLKTNLRPQYDLQDTLKSINLLIEVVDARDPISSRCIGLEKFPKVDNKLMVVMKGDLVPRQNLLDWLDYLRKAVSFPVIALVKDIEKLKKANKEAPPTVNTNKVLSTSVSRKAEKPEGFTQLVKILKNYTFDRVGIFGYPGVGKQTVASYLKIPSAQLPNKTKIMCCQIMDEEECNGLSKDLIFLQKPQTSLRPEKTLERMLERASKEDMIMNLHLQKFNDMKDLVEKVSKEKQLINGAPDASRSVLKTLNQKGFYHQVPSGKIQGDHESGNDLAKTVSSAPAVAYSSSKLIEDQTAGLKMLPEYVEKKNLVRFNAEVCKFGPEPFTLDMASIDKLKEADAEMEEDEEISDEEEEEEEDVDEDEDVEMA